MVKIGVLGNQGKSRTIDILAQLCRNSGMKVGIIKELNLGSVVYGEEVCFLNYIKELEKNNIDIAILRLTKEGIKNNYFLGIAFDIIIYTIDRGEEEYKKFYLDKGKLFFALNADGVYIMNADDRGAFKLLKGSRTRLITYGFNPRASITTSSIQQEDINKRLQFCVQRTLTTFSGKKLEPQEFSITLPLNQEQEVYSALAAVTAAMINDIDIGCKYKI
ncbi:MAG: hypothetical protein GX308_05715 [Epulopiscium sp.]|nr:hypothetical protein [Candidatus Epulonipiscium sp.]